ncbi:MAG: hypothetical protein EOO88_43215, partial [Pedobacter sp.]
TRLFNAERKLVRSVSTPALINASQNKEIVQDIPVTYPTLWSVASPYLYKASTIITEASTGKVLDEIEHSVGFRWFTFDASQGFFLNGKSLKLIGASRHQDRKGFGNAVPDSLARKDVVLLKEMGGNFLRVAHYPQDPAVLKACDELGILASVEIPVVNEITETDSFYNNCLQMQVEMIRQHYNHPSVIIWCYMNEVLLRPSFNDDKARQTLYFSNIAKLAGRLDSLTRKEDPFRYTMIAHHGNYNQYKEVGLIDIPMIVGWNLYQGWYGSKIEDLPPYLDRYHRDYPQKPMMITEYGADADPRIRSTDPVRFDKSIEYATYYHQYYLEQIMQRPFVAGAQVWNLADFNSETRNESMPHINNKGLLQWDRTPKDPYYFYNGVYYRSLADNEYEVVAPPLGATVNSLPAGAKATMIDGNKYYELNGTYYQEDITDDNKLVYTVVGTDGVLDTGSDNEEAPQQPQMGDRFDTLPADAKPVVIQGEKFYTTPSGLYYKEVVEDKKVYYEVVGQ